MDSRGLTIVAASELVNLQGRYFGVPAKIDTGAASTAVWASNIKVDEQGRLCFCLFDEGNKWYDGEVIVTEDYDVGIFRSSHGHEQIRYRVRMEIEIAGKSIMTMVSLADRSRNKFPVLIGVRALAGNFLVDVSKEKGGTIPMGESRRARGLREELKENRQAFYQKYFNSKKRRKK